MIIVFLLRVSAITDNLASRYFSFSVASLFAIRTVFCLISCFVTFISGTYLPLVGNLSSTAVDLILCFCAFSFAMKRTNEPDKISDT